MKNEAIGCFKVKKNQNNLTKIIKNY